MLIYHGSTEKVEKPKLNKGKLNNDFGRGFYCTNEIEKAKQWACKNNNNGILNTYELDFNNLKVLDLTSDDYNVLNWISLLINNRTFNTQNSIAKDGKKYLVDNYSIDTSKYDVVIGYRADDSYFSYAQSFIDNSLSINNLEKAISLGNLGKQIVLVSNKAFSHIKFIRADEVNKDIYFLQFAENDKKAREEYKQLINSADDRYLIDIMREGQSL